MDAYCDAILAARAEGLPVLVGVEMDWLPGRTAQIARIPRRPALRRGARLGALAGDARRRPPGLPRLGRPGAGAPVVRVPRRARRGRPVGPVRRAGPPGPAEGVRSGHAARARRAPGGGGRRHRGDGHRHRVLVGGPAQAGGRAVPRPEPAGAPARGRGAGDAGQRRALARRTSPGTTRPRSPPCARRATRPSPASRAASRPRCRCDGPEGRQRASTRTGWRPGAR